MKKKSKPAWANKTAIPGLLISETIGPKTIFPSFNAFFTRFLNITFPHIIFEIRFGKKGRGLINDYQYKYCSFEQL
jgi:hypothetical protein